MTPRKTRQRHQNSTAPAQPAVIQASDYESEAYYQGPITTRTNTELNLSVLRHHVPSIRSILSIAPSAQIYTYLPATTSWNKTDIEGTLFVCQLAPLPLSDAPQYCIVVLNRKGLENLIVHMNGIENVEITEEFLIVGVRSLDHGQQQNLEDADMKAIGLFIHADKQDTREVNCRLIKEKWEEVRLTGSGNAVTEPSNLGPMVGRRLSLTDLFGQQGVQ
ncbi:PH protein [Venustampulla echinocandica]|uniref:PH protein n=1 Tax=Venustampulla echinocandica TaxID=2656787 RepID=A0A370TY02_9HELO|nr:PH protein [Venustampulla echinocandica]RDL40388.1 PH protein [Venustampulla echinocandica]